MTGLRATVSQPVAAVILRRWPAFVRELEAQGREILANGGNAALGRDLIETASGLREAGQLFLSAAALHAQVADDSPVEGVPVVVAAAELGISDRQVRKIIRDPDGLLESAGRGLVDPVSLAAEKRRRAAA